jgi:hypothetical protein
MPPRTAGQLRFAARNVTLTFIADKLSARTNTGRQLIAAMRQACHLKKHSAFFSNSRITYDPSVRTGMIRSVTGFHRGRKAHSHLNLK